MITNENNWIATRIKPDQINKYLVGGKCFIDVPQIEHCLGNKCIQRSTQGAGYTGKIACH